MEPSRFKSVQIPAVVALASMLAGCKPSVIGAEESSSGDSRQEVGVSIQLGPVGTLARGARMDPRRLVLSFRSPSAGTVTDTILLSGNSQVSRSYSLPADQTWALLAQGRDQRDSLLYEGRTQFFLPAGTPTQVKLSMDSRYANLHLKIPLVDSVTRIQLHDLATLLLDSALSPRRHAGDTLVVERDYLRTTAYGQGWQGHSFLLRIWGRYHGTETLLYASRDSSMTLQPGVNSQANIPLDWVGPQTPPSSRVDLAVSLGSIAKLQAQVVYPDTTGGNFRTPWNPSVSYGTLIDVRDGQLYRTVRIGNQNWMAQNLNYDGGRNRPATDQGQFYRWTTAMGDLPGTNRIPSGIQGVCPKGWHLPSIGEWSLLWTTVGGRLQTLKALRAWDNSLGDMGDNTDSLGFRLVPTGYASLQDAFDGEGAYFWSATTSPEGRPVPQIFATGYGFMGEDRFDENTGLSVRCLQD